MGTTIAEDNAKFLSVITSMEVNAGAGAMGSLVYAGNLWPLGVANPNVIGATSTGRQMRREIDAAFVDARAMATAGFVKATAAIKGDEASGLLMKKWFGRRQTGVGDNDWWLGAQRILGNLQRQLLRDINASGTAVMMATHDLDLVRSSGMRSIELNKGALVFDSSEAPLPEREH